MAGTAQVESLEYDACLRRLATVTIGRIAKCQGSVPIVCPLRSALISGHILFTVPPGSRLWKAVANQLIAFQADGTSNDETRTWSVLVHGVCS